LVAKVLNLKVIMASSRQVAGLTWFNQIMSDQQSNRLPMALDYEVYADGEALLAGRT